MNENSSLPDGAADFRLESDGPRVIVVGVDGSPPSWRALHFGIGAARRQGSRVVVVYAHRIPALAYNALNPVSPLTAEVIHPDVPKELVDEIASLAREYPVDIQLLLVEGDAVAALTATAERFHADMIVVGASEKAGHRVFGSTAVRAVKARACPITVVP